MATHSRSELDYQPSYFAAGCAAVAVLILYLVTLAPSTAMWDTSEYIAAAYTLGLPHPPGNPLFVLLGRVMSLLPIAHGVAARINVFAALCSAAAAAMWFLTTERVLVSWFPDRWRRVLGASIATLIGATAFTVWNQSVVNEKVYTVSLAGIAIISWLMIRWSDNPDEPKADRFLVLVAYLLGLGYANHMAGFLAAPAVGLAVLVRRPKTILRWKLLVACMLALGFGLTPFAVQPIRAAYFPAINEGEPTACRNGLHLSCTFSSGTYEAFKYNFNRGQYGKPELSDRQAPFTAQVGLWWTYFKWQWIRDAATQRPFLQNLLAAVFLILGLAGGWVHYRRDRQSFWYFASLMFTMTLALIFYLNFKYGASQSPDLGSTVPREVRDRDYFFLWSYSAWGVWAGLGLLFIWESIASLFGTTPVKFGDEVIEQPTRNGWLAGSPVLLLAIIPIFANAPWASRAGQTDTRDFAVDLLNSVEPYGVLVVVGDNDTFPLWYAQEVEGIRKDVVVANTSLLNTDWYTRQLIRRPIFDYDAAKGPAIYRNKVWPKPAGSPLHMTMEQADSVPMYYNVTQAQRYSLGPISITIDPKALSNQDDSGHGFLTRADIFVLKMITDSYAERPIYFSRTSGRYPQELGLGNNVILQGLASKVFVPPAQPHGDTLFIREDGWIDLGRTSALWDSTFLAPKSLAKRHGWVDTPSIGIPYLYVATAVELAQLLHGSSHEADLGRVVGDAKGMINALNLNTYFPDLDAMLRPPPPLLVPSGDSAIGKPPTGGAKPPSGAKPPATKQPPATKRP